MSKLKAACAAWLAMAILLSSACSSTKPHVVAMRVPPKPQKTPKYSETQDESELEDPLYYNGPAVIRKNLPLAGTKWSWEGNLGQGFFDGAGQADEYSLEFKPNGWFDFRADCRHGTGMYEITGQHIVLAVMKATHSNCHQGSKAEDYQSALERAKAFRQSDDKLYIELKGSSKTMVFAQKP